MTETNVDTAKTGAAELLGVRLSRATEHIIWILLSIWLFFEAIPAYDESDEHWDGPASWFGSLWVEAGLPGDPLVDVNTGVWSTIDSPWAVWFFILLSAGTCGLAVGRPEKWGLRALSYLGIAGAVEATDTLWPVLVALVALGLVATIASLRCWFVDRYSGAENYMDYASPGIVFTRFLSDVVLHYLLPLLGPVILLLFTLQNFWTGPQPRPTDSLLHEALSELRKSSDASLTRKDLLSVLEVFISLNGASRQETKSLASWTLATRRGPSGATVKCDVK
ncbi:hypothetical protein [Nesterenkonia populi]